ncbi:MAG: ABC transporter ATP-binding protein [Candidatus Hinthialibacter antarcticus]|nr:ABC transporter ATP-binding protein [Candidatus Hinthialibacter antarcticus]
MNDATEILLDVQNLKTQFFTVDGVGRAVDGVSFQVKRGETLGLVGESGCGKSITSLSILRLVPNPPGRIVDGKILFKDQDLLQCSEKEMRKIRGNQISMIFQEPMTALNPVFTVGEQIAEVYRIHRRMGRRDAFNAAVEMMEKVRIPAAPQRAKEYPHQLSGGMRQRIMIAMALACDPDLLIADEPTTALDVTVQAQILALMDDLKERMNASIILITHDLGVIAEVADRVAVMYAGQIVEESPAEMIFSDPQHPYTQGLLRSIPSMTDETQARLNVISGTVPSPFAYPDHCRFEPRCEKRFEPCGQEVCPEIQTGNGRSVRCFLHDEEKKRLVGAS